MDAVREKANVYISYSHKDREYVSEFLKHLNILKRSGSINEIFIDQVLRTGQDWDKELKSFFNQSNIIIFFLSPDSLDSKNINSCELPDALKKNEAGEIYIFPILLRAVDFSGSPYSKFMISMPGQKPVLEWEDRDQAWLTIINELKEVIQRITNTAALKIIEAARASKAPILDLGNCGLRFIPQEIFELDWLEGLILGGSERATDYDQVKFFTSLNTEDSKAYDLKYNSGIGPWFTKNEGERNDLSSVNLNILDRLKKLQFLNIEACNFDIFSFDFTLLENLTVLLAGKNMSLTSSQRYTPTYANKSNLKVINISENNLSNLPPHFFEVIKDSIQYLNISLNPSISSTSLVDLKSCSRLLSLDIESTNIDNLFPLKDSQTLRWLNITRNNLSDVSVLNNLVALETLLLSYNAVKDLSPVSALSNLTLLFFSSNELTSIKGFENLKNIEALDLSNNKITDIEPLRNLTKLKVLYFNNNIVTSISALSNMSDLRLLMAETNQIVELKPLINCKMLETLFLGQNNISDITEVRNLVISLSKLNHISLINNPITGIDQGMLRHLTKREALLNYFKRIDEKGDVSNNEVKLILVGNSTAGKSTLRRMIQGKTFDDLEGTTHGIVKDQWQIPMPPSNSEMLTVNIWDFGGQEYYHETHKLFFSKHAVYVLVWEDSTNQNEILETIVGFKDTSSNVNTSKKYIEHYSCEYWLRNIRHYAPESPIIILQNKIDKYYSPATSLSGIAALTRIKKLPDEIINSYNVGESFDLSLAKVKDKDEDFTHDFDKFIYILKKRLKQTATNFKLETSFNTIKEELVKRKSENKWTRGDFDAFCKLHDPKINLDLLINYLSDISVILYFGERDELKNWVFINPVWVSEQIYHVLDNKVLENSGHFNMKHVEDKLGVDLAEEFISLMKQFQIIFRDERRQEFIAPQYLPDSNVNRYYNIVKAQFLQPRFVLEFPKFLPKTIMNNILSIYAGKAIESSYYKYGVAFETEFDKLNILEYDFKKNQVSFYSKNDDQYNSREVFEAVLSLFENIKINDSTITSMDPTTESILQTEKVKVLLSLDGETFVNWNKLFLGRSQLQDNIVLIPERGREIHAGAFNTYYQSKEEIRNRKTSAVKKEPIKIFISYSHKDEAYKDELIEHLSGLKRQGIIHHWTDRAIVPGEKWDAIIKKNLDESRVILFLVSPSFMASDYIQDHEIKAAIEKSELPNNNVTLVPIPVRPCDFTSLSLKNYQGAIKDFKAVSSWTNKDEAWLDVVNKLKLLIQEKFAGTTA